MDWLFVVTIGVVVLGPPPTKEHPIQQRKTEQQEIVVRVSGRDRCVELMKQWEGKSRVGDHIILQKKCTQAPTERPTRPEVPRVPKEAPGLSI
jgi:hypothetical protein